MYPLFLISGIPIVPIAAHVAGLDPLRAANIEQAPILETTKPPGNLHSHLSKPVYQDDRVHLSDNSSKGSRIGPALYHGSDGDLRVTQVKESTTMKSHLLPFPLQQGIISLDSHMRCLLL